MMQAAQLAETYFAHMRARDLAGLESLFADDARFTLPDGRVLSGIAEIRAMYTGLFATTPPAPSPASITATGSSAAVEIVTQLPNGDTRRTANFFHLGPDGRIAELNVYRRG